MEYIKWKTSSECRQTAIRSSKTSIPRKPLAKVLLDHSLCATSGPPTICANKAKLYFLIQFSLDCGPKYEAMLSSIFVLMKISWLGRSCVWSGPLFRQYSCSSSWISVSDFGRSSKAGKCQRVTPLSYSSSWRLQNTSTHSGKRLLACGALKRSWTCSEIRLLVIS